MCLQTCLLWIKSLFGSKVNHACIWVCVQNQEMVGGPKRQYDIKQKKSLEKSNKLYTMSVVISTVHIALVPASINRGFKNKPWRYGHFGQR